MVPSLDALELGADCLPWH